LIAGLNRCGTLTYAGTAQSKGPVRRLLRRFSAFWRIAFWIVGREGTILIHGRQFTQFPYSIFYLLNRLRGGKGFAMARIRMVDEGHHFHRRIEFQTARSKPSWMSRLVGRDCDGLIHYHDQQETYLGSYAKFGSTDWLRRTKIGLPNAFPSWRSLIAEAAETERRKLAVAGHNVEEIYSFFAAKGYSSTHLRTLDSAVHTFKLILRTLSELRPSATILVRPHPLALREAWLKDALAAIRNPNIVVCSAHPEVMVILSRCAFANNPTNIMFTTPFGRFIDCSDYKTAHYEKAGEKSLAEGYGVIFVNPARDDFAERLRETLADEPWSNPDIFAKRERLLAKNGPSVDQFLTWLD
jgi:hypothetical protein